MTIHRCPRSQFLWMIALLLATAGACAMSRPNENPTGVAHPHAGSTTAAATAPANSTDALLTITVKDLRNRKGDLIFGVFANADGFPNVKAKSVYWEVKPANAGTRGETISFTAYLPPGRYAAGVLHDENRSGDMDTGVGGIPLEGYGVTNNPKPRFRKARFDEATFTLPPNGAQMTISLQYFQ